MVHPAPVQQWTRLAAMVGCLATVVLPCVADAQTGVSDDRVSLPDGPGSLDGVGDNASVNPNMGMMTYTIPISVPAGVNGQTPRFDLAYSSGGGNGVLGMGWSMALSSIERMTSKGLPEYLPEDRFVADGSQELVRVSDGEPAVYRARYEGGFVRYSWHNRGAGDEGYWTAAYPDGSVSTFGADRTGANVETSRVRSPDGVFRYLLVDRLDMYGNRISYDYRYYGAVPLLDFVGWVFGDDGNPRFSVQLEYETREDPISDARGGFNERTAHRATDLRVFSEDTLIRRYAFAYENYATSGGVSRLVEVARHGRDGGEYGVKYSMTYSRALAGVCDGVECESPVLTTAGTIGAGFGTGRVNLIDLNGDSIPDAVLTPPSGAHRIYLGTMNGDGEMAFAAPFDSAVGDSGTFELSSPYTQVIDYDGDGFTDLLDSLSGRVLVNKGVGDWHSVASLGGVQSLPDFAEDFELDGENELTHIRFTDIDGDRKIDVLRSDATGTSLFRNLGEGGFASAPVDPIEAGFADDTTDLADVNGDGLLDPVQLRDGVLRYRLSLGRGKWAAWAEMTGMPFNISELPFVELEDLNGDGMDDVVLVQGASIRYALNRNNAAFSPEQTIDSIGGQPLPNADDTVTVLYADMNANGSNDIVWIDDNGSTQFLDLFPIRPHLLSRLENGVGYTIDVAYGSMARERASSTAAEWPHPVPMATLVVNSLDVYTQADDPALIFHDVIEYSYTGGYYDGAEKQFRGFERATLTQALDDGSFENLSVYDVGSGDDRGHFAGLTLESHLSDSGVELQVHSSIYAECPLDDLGDGAGQIRWACQIASESLHKEHAPQSDWVTTREENEYDGYGNLTKRSNLGVVTVGGAGCAPCDRLVGETGAPCGAQCLGDEIIVETDYIAPSDVSAAYQVNLVREIRESATEGGPTKREQYFYDGADFDGLPLGQASRGVLIRKARLAVEGEAPLDTLRIKVDAYGNTVDQLRGGQSIDAGDHLRTVYSADGRDILRVFRTVDSAAGTLTHAVDFAYSSDFGLVSSTTGWYLDGRDDASERRRFWTYDEHGRVKSEIRPGNTLESPSLEYTYELASPYSRVITRKRSTIGGAYDVEEITCMDGLGRATQTRAKVADRNYLVAAFTSYDRAGNPVKVFQPYTASDGTCASPPSVVRATEYLYDGLDRMIEKIEPNAEPGETNRSRTEYLPMAYRSSTPDDTDESSEGFDTPTTIRTDGQERIVSVERTQRGGVVETFRFEYDALGRASAVISPEGLAKEQVYDLADRLISVRDVDAGETTFVYDASGDPIAVTDGRGRTVSRAFDTIGRKIEEWDAADRDATLTEFFYDVHPACPTEKCEWGAARLVGQRSRSRLGDVVDGSGFDLNGTLIHAFRQVGDVIFESNIDVDNADRVRGQRFTGGTELAFDVDLMGRPTSIAGLVSQIGYTEFGQVGGYTTTNGVATSFDYDARLQIKSLRAPGVIDLALTRDSVDTVTSIVDGVGTGALSLSATYDFDDVARLVQAVLDDETIDYDVDALDRILSKTSSRATSAANVGAFTYATEHPRAVVEAGGIDFTYDAGGFVTERGQHAFTFDALGRLSRVTGGAVDVTIDRDGYGKRTVAQLGSEQRLYFGRGFEVRDGVTRVRVLVGDDTVAFVESAAVASTMLGMSGPARAVTAADAFGVSGQEQRVRLRSGARRLLLDVAGDTAFVHSDHLGSTIAVTNLDGDVVERLSYYPFGELRASTAKETTWVSFTGVDDDGLGYLDYNNRVYSPREGRWLSPDPKYLAFDGGTFSNPGEAFTTYAYVGNSPTSLIDIDGYEGGSTAKKVATVVGGGANVAGGVLAGVAAGATTAGAANIAGAVAQGAVSGAREAVAQRAQMRADFPAGDVPVSRQVWAGASVVWETAKGAAVGFATAGASLIPTAVEVGADVVIATSDSARVKTVAQGVKFVAGASEIALLAAHGHLGANRQTAEAAVGAVGAGAGAVSDALGDAKPSKKAKGAAKAKPKGKPQGAKRAKAPPKPAAKAKPAPKK